MMTTPDGPPAVETTLAVAGMSCHSCVSHVSSALLDLDGVVSVQVDLSRGLARVRHLGDAAMLDGLIEAIADAGYEASPTT